MKVFKIKTLCRFRRNEGENKFSIEFCKTGYDEYAVYVLRGGNVKWCKIGTDYHDVKLFFKKCVAINM